MNFKEKLKKASEDAGISMNDLQLDQFEEFYHLLIEKNKTPLNTWRKLVFKCIQWCFFVRKQAKMLSLASYDILNKQSKTIHFFQKIKVLLDQSCPVKMQKYR